MLTTHLTAVLCLFDKSQNYPWFIQIRIISTFSLAMHLRF